MCSSKYFQMLWQIWTDLLFTGSGAGIRQTICSSPYQLISSLGLGQKNLFTPFLCMHFTLAWPAISSALVFSPFLWGPSLSFFFEFLNNLSKFLSFFFKIVCSAFWVSIPALSVESLLFSSTQLCHIYTKESHMVTILKQQWNANKSVLSKCWPIYLFGGKGLVVLMIVTGVTHWSLVLLTRTVTPVTHRQRRWPIQDGGHCRQNHTS